MDDIVILMQDIKDYEDLYSITNSGRVWSKLRDGSGGHTVKWLKPDTKPNGYQTVTLVKNKVKQRFLLHRLVAISYIENPQNKPYVNHLDGNKQNNCVSNLEWCTGSENEQHSYTVLNKQASKHCLGKTGYESHRGKEVGQYTLEDELIATYGSGADAARSVGCSQTSISAVCTGKRTNYKGYIWKYI